MESENERKTACIFRWNIVIYVRAWFHWQFVGEKTIAGVAELADAHDSKSCGEIRAGSSPATGTRIFSPELTEFRAFLLPDSLYSGVLRVKCEDRICWRNLAAIIKVGVNIRCRSDVAMSQPLLDVPQTDTVGVKKAGTAMPLRYNYDKPGKPWITNGFWDSAPWFFVLFQPEKSSRMKANFWRC